MHHFQNTNRQNEEFKETLKTIIPVRSERYLNQIFTDLVSQLKQCWLMTMKLTKQFQFFNIYLSVCVFFNSSAPLQFV